MINFSEIVNVKRHSRERVRTRVALFVDRATLPFTISENRKVLGGSEAIDVEIVLQLVRDRIGLTLILDRKQSTDSGTQHPHPYPPTYYYIHTHNAPVFPSSASMTFRRRTSPTPTAWYTYRTISRSPTHSPTPHLRGEMTHSLIM